MSAPMPPSSRPPPSTEVLPPPTGATPVPYVDVLRGRGSPTQFADPCEIARQESMKCLDRNSYDRPKCNDFFQAYRDCKANWLEQRRDDRRNGRATK